MQVTIDIEPQTYSLLQKIREKGISLDDVLSDALIEAESESDISPNDLSVEERLRRLREWVNMPRNLPPQPLSDEALSRESIYEDRGL
ncbi:MAG: hypothetical protein KF855_09840 [Acidobacteria bacterium]|nr:hypothetical protein [Acidobacteriota bacterium]